jgi:hypothetical protein
MPGGARMPGRVSARLNWALALLAVLGYVVYLLLGIGGPSVNGPGAFTLDDAVWVLGQVVLAVVGALITARRQDLSIGWLFCAAGLIGIVEGVAARYAVHALAGRSGPLSGGSAAWPVRGLELLGPSPASPRAPLATALMNVAALMLVAAAVATAVALLLRFRRARGVEREQLKWLTYSGAVAVVGLLLFLLPNAVGVGSLPGPLGLAGIGFTAGGVLGIPVAVGVAILRYRLYDIDRIINRTLVYGLLTALLGGTYAGMVLGLGQLLGRTSSLVVAVATLTIAAAFQPARRRIQSVADRRFNRRRYDAIQTIEAFSARLRQQLDLEALSAELLAVVNQTMEPTTASLWLRPSPDRTGGSPEPADPGPKGLEPVR